jgi:hypothetical protein
MAEPQRLEAGNYQLEVVDRGYYSLRRAQRIPGGVLTREVVELGREQSASSASALPEADSASEAWWLAPWVGWTLAGASAASAVTAGIAFAIREEQAAQWNDDSRCVLPGGRTREQECGGDYGDARLAERIGITASVGAILFGGAAAVHFLTARSADEQAASSSDGSDAGWNATCTPGFMGVVCEGRF